MNTVTIQVAQVSPPQPGKKRGKISDTQGNTYQAGYPMLNNFQPGGTYTINYKDDSFNGFAFKVIEGLQSAPGTANPPPLASQQTTAVPQTHTPKGAHSVNDPLPERIFVCGALNAALGNPNVNPATLTTNQLTVMVKSYREVFARTFGGKPTVADELDDEIPFEQTRSGGFS